MRSIKAAQRQGQLNLIPFAGLNIQRPVQDFGKKYGIKVNYQTRGGRWRAERILAGRRMRAAPSVPRSVGQIRSLHSFPMRY